MPRNLTGAALLELTALATHLAVFVEVEIASGFVRFWTGIQDVTWDSKIWTAAGKLLSIRPAAETTELRANGLEIELEGIDPTLIGQALTETRQGKPVNCWLGFLDSNGVVIANPSSFFKGRLDTTSVTNGTEEASISVFAEGRMIILNRAVTLRYTDEDQRVLFPGDDGFIHVNQLQEFTGQWGGGPIGSVDVSDGGFPIGRLPRKFP